MLANVLITAHVVAAVLLIGPITVAASRFLRCVRAAAGPGPGAARAVAGELHSITRGYAALSVLVPALGVGVASYLQVFTQRWLIVAIGLTVVAAVLLAWVIVPGQARLLRRLDDLGPGGGAVDALRPEVARLGAATGAFGLLWVVIAALMVLRPRFGA